jgi:hypothetical protein
MELLHNDFIVIKLEAVQWPPTTVTSGDVFQASVRLNDASDSWRPRLGDSMHLVTEFIPLELPPGVESVHDNIFFEVPNFDMYAGSDDIGELAFIVSLAAVVPGKYDLHFWGYIDQAGSSTTVMLQGTVSHRIKVLDTAQVTTTDAVSV